VFAKTHTIDDNVKAYLKAWLLEQNFARIKYGTYTGDGAVSQAITGVGFAPEIVIITLDGAGADSGVWFCTKQMAADECQEMISAGAATASIDKVADHIIALGTDGFTVDDGGADAHPNKNTQVYDYLAIG